MGEGGRKVNRGHIGRLLGFQVVSDIVVFKEEKVVETRRLVKSLLFSASTVILSPGCTVESQGACQHHQCQDPSSRPSDLIGLRVPNVGIFQKFHQ